MHSHFGLQLRLALALSSSPRYSRAGVLLLTWSSSKRPVTWRQSRLTGDHPRPAMLVIFPRPTSSPGCARRNASARAARPNARTAWRAHVSGAESAVDPAPLAHGKPIRWGPERLRLELVPEPRPRPAPTAVEPRAPAPFGGRGAHPRGSPGCRSGTARAERHRRLPRELGVIAGPPREARWMSISGWVLGAWISPMVHEGRQRLVAEGERRAVVERPAAEGQQVPAVRWRRSARR